MSPDYGKELLNAREFLAVLLSKREEIEVAIARQRRKVAAWSELCDESEIGDSANGMLGALGLDLGGLSDACRTAMRASRKEWMTIAEIQETLKELGFLLDKYKAPTASITTTVNRLAESGEVVAEKPPGGTSEYRWVGQAGQASLNAYAHMFGHDGAAEALPLADHPLQKLRAKPRQK